MIRIDTLTPCLPNRQWRWSESAHLWTPAPDDAAGIPAALERLHAFADSIGLRKQWMQWKEKGLPHYDLTPGRYPKAVTAGANYCDRATLVADIRAWRALQA